MSITVGHIYKFSFEQDFENLNGIYKVTHAMDYDTLLVDDVDLLKSLFEPANLTDIELQAALPTIKTDTFYRLVTIDGQTELYVPYQYVVGIPVPDVFEYAKLMLVVDLGPWAEPDVLAGIQSIISDYLENAYGIVEQPEVMAYDNVWMAESDYEATKDARQTVITNGTGTINYFTETQKKQVIIDAKDARIAALEALVVQLHDQLNP